jgi:predicted small lipoprotein YifL
MTRKLLAGVNLRNVAFLLAILAFTLFGSMVGCSNKAPLKIQDLNYVMPGDNKADYDVYRVISVKKDVTNQELVGLMEYFTQLYIDKNRVMIYVFNMPVAAHTGESKHLVATYFHDKAKKQYDREILLNTPHSQF